MLGDFSDILKAGLKIDFSFPIIQGGTVYTNNILGLLGGGVIIMPIWQ